ncbi:MAG: multidrug effflux MFS transporter [Acidobacteriota bacterium]|jgi:DHA1 family bicyclomycin/chloramphenicol resistance-like MFS transporter|nr:multidrug effflux MFS transporter [Acidobacteriota bacterium]
MTTRPAASQTDNPPASQPAPAENPGRPTPKGFSIAGITFVLAVLSWMGPFAIDAYLPSFSAIAKHMQVSKDDVQLTMTAFMLFLAVMSLWHGALADAYGRRRPILVTLAIFCGASLGCAFAGNVTLLMVFRAMQGATVGAGMIIGRAVIRDLFEGAAAQRLMSHVATIFAIAPVMAPILGGLFQGWFGWRAIFFFMAGMSACMFVCCWFALPETLPREHRQRLDIAFLARSYWKVGSAVPFTMSCAALSLVNIGFFIYILGAPMFLEEHLKLSEKQYFILFIPVSIAMVIGAWISGRCAGKMTGIRTIVVGFIIMAVAAVGNVLLNLTVPPALPWTLAPIFVYVLGMSTASPSLTLLSLDLFPSQRGLAASCQGFIILIANPVASEFVTLIWGTTLSMAGAMLGILACAIVAMTLYGVTVKKFHARTGTA